MKFTTFHFLSITSIIVGTRRATRPKRLPAFILPQTVEVPLSPSQLHVHLPRVLPKIITFLVRQFGLYIVISLKVYLRHFRITLLELHFQRLYGRLAIVWPEPFVLMFWRRVGLLVFVIVSLCAGLIDTWNSGLPHFWNSIWVEGLIQKVRWRGNSNPMILRIKQTGQTNIFSLHLFGLFLLRLLIWRMLTLVPRWWVIPNGCILLGILAMHSSISSEFFEMYLSRVHIKMLSLWWLYLTCCDWCFQNDLARQTQVILVLLVFVQRPHLILIIKTKMVFV